MRGRGADVILNTYCTKIKEKRLKAETEVVESTHEIRSLRKRIEYLEDKVEQKLYEASTYRMMEPLLITAMELLGKEGSMANERKARKLVDYLDMYLEDCDDESIKDILNDIINQKPI